MIRFGNLKLVINTSCMYQKHAFMDTGIRLITIPVLHGEYSIESRGCMHACMQVTHDLIILIKRSFDHC